MLYPLKNKIKSKKIYLTITCCSLRQHVCRAAQFLMCLHEYGFACSYKVNLFVQCGSLAHTNMAPALQWCRERICETVELV